LNSRIPEIRSPRPGPLPTFPKERAARTVERRFLRIEDLGFDGSLHDFDDVSQSSEVRNRPDRLDSLNSRCLDFYEDGQFDDGFVTSQFVERVRSMSAGAKWFVCRCETGPRFATSNDRIWQPSALSAAPADPDDELRQLFAAVWSRKARKLCNLSRLGKCVSKGGGSQPTHFSSGDASVAKSRTCPECHGELRADAPEGPCPEYLFKDVIGSGNDQLAVREAQSPPSACSSWPRSTSLRIRWVEISLSRPGCARALESLGEVLGKRVVSTPFRSASRLIYRRKSLER
jgi:hypothetical protein